jgi:hypothetical protein
MDYGWRDDFLLLSRFIRAIHAEPDLVGRLSMTSP